MTGGSPAGPRGVGRTSGRSGRGQEDLPQVREGLGGLPQVRVGSGGPPAGSGGVRKTSRRSGRGREYLLQVWESSRGPLAGPRGVGKTSRKSGRGREDFPQVREVLPQIWDGSGGPLAGPGGVGKTSRSSEGVGKTFRRSVRISRRSGRASLSFEWVREDLPQVREGSGGPLAGPGGIGRTSRRSGRCRDDLPQFW